MRIKELDIRRYGPLPEFPRQSLSSFTLFYGNNEHGKTLLIDAMIRLLFDNKLSRGRKGFDAVKRVPDRPEGSLVLERDGEEFVVMRGKSINDFLDPPLTIADFRNIFVARDSDLEIVSDDGYYTHVSEKFTDLRTGEIRTALKVLQERGRLTSLKPGCELANSKEAGYAAQKVRQSEVLIDRIDALVTDLKGEQFDLLERRLVEYQEALASMLRETELQEDAAAREKLEDARKHVAALVSRRERLSALDSLSDEELASWRQLEEKQRECRSEIERLTAVVSEMGTKLERARGERTLAEEEIEQGASRKQLIDNKLRPAMHALRRNRESYIESRPAERIWRMSLVLSLFFLAAAIAAILVQGSPLFVVFGTICLLLSLWSAVQIVSQTRKKGGLERDLDALLLDAAPIHDGGRSLESLERSIAAAEEAHEKGIRARARKDHEIDGLRRDIEHDRGRLVSLRAERLKCEETIERFGTVSKQQNREEYRRALDEKKELSSAIQKLTGILESTVGPAAQTEDQAAYWKSEIDRRSVDGSSGVAYDPPRHQELKEQIAGHEEAVTRLRATLGSRRNELGEIAYKVNEAAILDDDAIRCRSIGDLAEIRNRLELFRDRIVDDKNTAQETIAVFQAIEQEEKSRVAELFGAGKAVSTYFSGITGSFYDEVRFDPVTEQISVKVREKGELGIDTLSGGTLDQLYFSIRLSLGERFLGGEKGFFILDDPFIKADFERLEFQLELLRSLVGEGWQILYFTAKREVRELLADDIAAGRIQLIHLTERM